MVSAPPFSLPENQRYELFHNAYVKCVSALAGMSLSKPSPDCGLDVSMRPNQWDEGARQYSPVGVTLDFQLKATTQWKIKNKRIEYTLKGKNYNDLVTRNSVRSMWNPLILVLFCLPKSPPYIWQNTMGLTLMRCCYWYILDKNIIQKVNKKTSKKLYIPVQNVFSADALTYLASKAWNGWGGVTEE